MSEKNKSGDSKQEKKKRLAEALRANLQRRKAQGRARKHEDGADSKK